MMAVNRDTPICTLRRSDVRYRRYWPLLPLALVAGVHLAPAVAGWGATRLGAQLPILILAGVMLVLVHEALHLLMMRMAGDRLAHIRWGLSASVALSGPHAYTRHQYLAVLLAPFMVLVPLTIATSWGLYPAGPWIAVALAGAGHAIGCCTDVFLAAWVLRLPAGSWVVNHAPNPVLAYATRPDVA